VAPARHDQNAGRADRRKRRLSILGLGGQPDSKADIVDDHQDLVGKLKAEF